MRSYKRNIQVHKRHFQLLELMVAMFLLLICIVPAMQIFTSMYVSQSGIIRENQRDHIARMAHANFTEMLYKREIPLDENDKDKIINVSDHPQFKELKELLHQYSYECSGTLDILNTLKSGGKPAQHLGLLTITMRDKSPEAQKKSSYQRDEKEKDPCVTEYPYVIYIDRTADGDDGDDDDETSNANDENQEHSSPEVLNQNKPTNGSNPQRAIQNNTPVKPNQPRSNPQRKKKPV